MPKIFTVELVLDKAPMFGTTESNVGDGTYVNINFVELIVVSEDFEKSNN